jgi:hypothetical protein
MAAVAVWALDSVGNQTAELRLELGVADDGTQLLNAVRKLVTDRKEET